jgi:hypothetical protein
MDSADFLCLMFLLRHIAEYKFKLLDPFFQLAYPFIRPAGYFDQHFYECFKVLIGAQTFAASFWLLISRFCSRKRTESAITSVTYTRFPSWFS